MGLVKRGCCVGDGTGLAGRGGACPRHHFGWGGRGTVDAGVGQLLTLSLSTRAAT